jgi:WD40 repeat protein
MLANRLSKATVYGLWHSPPTNHSKSTSSLGLVTKPSGRLLLHVYSFVCSSVCPWFRTAARLCTCSHEHSKAELAHSSYCCYESFVLCLTHQSQFVLFVTICFCFSRIWDDWRGIGVCKATLEGHTNQVNCVAVSPDGRMLASGSDDKTIKYVFTLFFPSHILHH